MSAILFLARDQVRPKSVVKKSSLNVPIIIFMQKKLPKKIIVFVQKSKINCVYYKRHKDKMSILVHAVFNFVFGNVDFVIVFCKIRGRKKRFPGSSQNSNSEKSNFGLFEVIFLNVQNFPRAGVVFYC